MDCEKDEGSAHDLLKEDFLTHQEVVEDDRPDRYDELVDHGPGDSKPFDTFIPGDMSHHA